MGNGAYPDRRHVILISGSPFAEAEEEALANGAFASEVDYERLACA